MTGDYRQGVVVLLLLSDSPPGWGGTAMLSGSQHWVYHEMLRHAAAGHPARSHEELNAFFVTLMRALTESGRVLLPGCNSAAATSASFADFPWGTDTPVSVEQVVGCAGDVILMHPLLLHSGTSNEGTELRLMANGMVCPRAIFFYLCNNCMFMCRFVNLCAKVNPPTQIPI